MYLISHKFILFGFKQVWYTPPLKQCPLHYVLLINELLRSRIKIGKTGVVRLLNTQFTWSVCLNAIFVNYMRSFVNSLFIKPPAIFPVDRALDMERIPEELSPQA